VCRTPVLFLAVATALLVGAARSSAGPVSSPSLTVGGPIGMLSVDAGRAIVVVNRFPDCPDVLVWTRATGERNLWRGLVSIVPAPEATAASPWRGRRRRGCAGAWAWASRSISS
jgi:hypothetical protein